MPMKIIQAVSIFAYLGYIRGALITRTIIHDSSFRFSLSPPSRIVCSMQNEWKERPSSELDPKTPQHLHSFLQRTATVDPELCQVIEAVADACACISGQLARLPILEAESRGISPGETKKNVHGETQKAMDIIANDIFKCKVQETVAAMASEEEEAVVVGSGKEKTYEIAFGPLDGSSNLEVNIATGTIFGIAPHNSKAAPFSYNGRSLVAAGYALYSASTNFVLSLGPSSGVFIFTLDPATDTHKSASHRFILSCTHIHCPTHGPYYSLNEAREPDWPHGLCKWIHDAKRGLTSTKTPYSSRYVCSLCADVHRTLFKGGWAGNPRPHLRLLYEAMPLAHVMEAAGGKGSDGTQNLLDVVPKGLHDRIPVFIGSRGDVEELEDYGDVQQDAAVYRV